MSDYHTFADAMGIDAMLYQLATYEVTKGRIVTCKTMDEEMECQRAIVAKFNYFKRYIRTGEYTFPELRDYILGKYGPYLQKPRLTEEESLKQLENFANNPAQEDDKEVNTLVPSPMNFLDMLGHSNDTPISEESDKMVDEAFKTLLDFLSREVKPISDPFKIKASDKKGVRKNSKNIATKERKSRNKSNDKKNRRGSKNSE